MARRRTPGQVELPAPAAGKAGRILSAIGTAVNWSIAACALVGCLWGAWKVERFVVHDKRFVLEGPPEPGIPSERFQIIGVTHASERSITDVFARDFGRSIYLCPIEERRRRLLAINWVQDATINRIWPDRVIVRITERVPVAFVHVPAQDGTTVYGLVDEHGVLLDPQRTAELELPVLSGVPAGEDESKRRERVKRFLRLQSELGSSLDDIAEIDVSDPDNVKVLQVMDGRTVTLMLGNQGFKPRYRNFLDNYAEIQKRLPDATVLDLRLPDRITVVASAKPDRTGAAKERRR